MRSIIAENQKVHIIDMEKPTIEPSYVLLKTIYSAISPGTEHGIIENSKEKKTNLGYSAVGLVEECGEGVKDYQKGDIVACYGAPYVEHSEYLLVPTTLCAKVPDGVDLKEAALAGIGAIAIHGLRIADLQFGESTVIAGLGMFGQLIAKIAQAAAYDVIGYDISEHRTEMLEEETNIKSISTLNELEKQIEQTTNGHGVDSVLLCAGGKKSPLTHQSLEWICKQGKIVIVGDIEPDFPRSLMFAKEAKLLISRAGGPGRYDSVYERQAIDYPYEYVRWTEGRNIAEYLRLVAEKKINVSSLVKDEVMIENAVSAYEDLLDKSSTILTKIIKY